MTYDKRKSWTNGQLPPDRVTALLRRVSARLAGLAGLRGRVVCVSAPRDLPDVEVRDLLELGFYWGNRRGCWAHSGEYRQPQTQPKPAAAIGTMEKPAQDQRSMPEAVFTLDRGRIAAAMENSRQAAQLIQNAIAGA